MKRRSKLINKRRFLVFITISLSILSSLFFLCSLPKNAVGRSEAGYRTIFAAEGDTLWEIASRCNINEDTRKLVYDIKRMNNMKSSSLLQVGQEIKVPAN